jgi:vacuolar protein sorting-associated protein 53
MSRIREKATESEAVVRNITKDIQVLDLAKSNLIMSMTALKRLQMLGMSFFTLLKSCSDVGNWTVNALTQLEDLLKDKKYAEITQTLGVSTLAPLLHTLISVHRL